MKSRKIYLLRHGEIEMDNEKRYIGRLDLPLSVAGRQQAARLRDYLAKLEIEAVYCSDLSRARDTAQIICEINNIKPILCKGLREINLGEWEGKTFSEIKEMFPDAYYRRGKDLSRFQPPGGESFHQCSIRGMTALYEILRNSKGNILAVAHAGLNRGIICHVLGIPLDHLFRIGQDYGCLNELTFNNTGFSMSRINFSIGQTG